MTKPRTAMVLAAGLGKRMAPITDTIPKPLVKVAGKPLIDWGLDALANNGVERAIVNTHYLADQLDAHLVKRSVPGFSFQMNVQSCLILQVASSMHCRR